MKTREEILENLKTHLQELEETFAFDDEGLMTEFEEIDLSARIETVRWTINLFEEL